MTHAYQPKKNTCVYGRRRPYKNLASINNYHVLPLLKYFIVIFAIIQTNKYYSHCKTDKIKKIVKKTTPLPVPNLFWHLNRKHRNFLGLSKTLEIVCARVEMRRSIERKMKVGESHARCVIKLFLSQSCLVLCCNVTIHYIYISIQKTLQFLIHTV